MRIMTFRGRSMQETLELVRREAGEEAVILSTGTSLAGEYEVSVAIEKAGKRTRQIPATRPGQQRSSRPAAAPPPDSPKDSELSRRLSVLESYIRFQVPYESPIFTRLLDSGVEEPIVRRIAETCAAVTPQETEAYVRRQLLTLLDRFEPLEVNEGERRVVAFVGATGVGKTLTIAKLAARFSLVENRRVGLLTQDVQRVAAIQQLRTYARILDLPIETLARPQDADAALTALSDRELILLDTAGLGGQKRAPVEELATLLDAVDATDVILALPATASAAHLRATARRLSPLSPTRVIVTKLDESVRPGVLLTCTDLGLPISHVTIGPAVPDDIRLARAEHLSTLILREPTRV